MPGTGLIINGKRVPVPGLDVTNWLDDPAFRLGPGDMRKRTEHERWVRLVVLHSTLGIPGGTDQRPQVLKPGLGPGGDHAERLVRFWTREARGAGAHLIVDFDGRVFCCADLATEAAYHASHANGVSVGIEITQGHAEAEMYSGQLDAAVLLVDAITALFGIQRMVPAGPYPGPSHRLMNSVEDVVGVLGHRDISAKRGAGDPGSRVFYRLGAAGYEPVNYDLGEDRERWRLRQRTLEMSNVDGIAGPQTVKAIREANIIPGLKGPRRAGLWVDRPIDSILLGEDSPLIG